MGPSTSAIARLSLSTSALLSIIVENAIYASTTPTPNIVAVEEMVKWLGFEPKRVTYSSDNFDRLYGLAEALIAKYPAYVCHCTKPEVIAQRCEGEGEGKPRYACSHRNRPVTESLAEVRGMRDGKYGAGQAALRMKQNLDDGNLQMWDLFAYRIPDKEHRRHHRTEDMWRMYPTPRISSIGDGKYPERPAALLARLPDYL
ncbi:MAG: hypothetical protein LQ338_002156 [Usnochroma carphineum]|nr:MAG: hypothetical protein LQ338_002156 [Usnochroma carphineum]